ncbi:MAG TPA: hypothetical protein DCZ95_05230 [Verrucomicrobia bacterium]|nr:hypothetical protein [Verrucomicrobiota bacterium]
MFGLFERCLKETGRRVTHIPTLNDLDVMNPQPDVVIMINPTGVVEQAEQKLYSYLATGGSLLLMGDHTDIAGSQECLNRILHPLGASIRFDSGFPAGRAWSLRYDLQCHRVTASLDRMNQGLQWGTGATLDLKGISWFPLLIGKYVFSDIGNRLNTNNAFLGDYSYQPGELLGDVILAAERSVGRGRIVALGDTTSFQNLAIIRSWPFLDRLVTHLTGRSHAQGQLMFALSVCVFASLLIILFWSQTWRLLAISTIVLAASGLDLLARRPWEVKYPPRPVALVDVCYANRLNLEHWRNDSIDGLLINLIRSGFWPILSNTTGIEDINAPSAKIVIAPQKKRSKSDFASWENDAMAGTTLLLSVGYPTETSVACWLQEQGLIINNEPLGPVPIRGRGPYENFLRRSQEPQFSEAWSVSLQSAVWKSIYAWGGRDVVVERNLGLGRLVVIADPLFLLDRTLEAEKEAWPGNIYFLQSLLHNQPGTAN